MKKNRSWLPAWRTAVAVLLGLILGIGIAGGLWWYSSDNSTGAAATPTTTSTAAASLSTIRKTISASGTVTPTDQQDVAFVASGTVTEVAATEGQAVTAGQALATVDTLTMQQTLASAKLTLAKAQATLVSDQTKLDDAHDALTTAQGAGEDTTSEELAVATTTQQIEVDNTAIAIAQKTVDTAQTALDSTTLTSPIDGVVSTVNVAVGDKVTGTAAASSSSGSASGSASGTSSGSASGTSSGSASSGSSAGSTTGSSDSLSSGAAFVVVGTSFWSIDVTVDDAQIDVVAAGDQAEISVTSSGDLLFGTIGSVGLISTSTGDTASYPVTVTSPAAQRVCTTGRPRP